MAASYLDALERSSGGRVTRRASVGFLPGMVVLLGSFTLGVPDESAAFKKQRGNDKKITLCHGGLTIRVAKKRKKQHIKHGDTLGECPPARPTTSLIPPDTTRPTATVGPNSTPQPTSTPGPNPTPQPTSTPRSNPTPSATSTPGPGQLSQPIDPASATRESGGSNEPVLWGLGALLVLGTGITEYMSRRR